MPKKTPPTSLKTFSPGALPPALRREMSVQWIARDLQAKELLLPCAQSHLRDNRSAKALVEVLGVAALAGFVAMAMHKAGNGAVESMWVGVLAFAFGIVPLLLRGDGAGDEGKKFWLHNYGIVATGVLASDAIAVIGRSLAPAGLAIMYTFEDAKGRKHMGGDALDESYLQYKDALKGGQEIQVLYHPDHPEMNTICLPQSMAEYCLRNDAGL